MTWFQKCIKIHFHRYGRVNISRFYIQRFFRITPLLCVTIMLTMSVRLFGSGPLQPITNAVWCGDCNQNWWMVVLYIQNYIKPATMVWQIASDFEIWMNQCLLICPICIVFDSYVVRSRWHATLSSCAADRLFDPSISIQSIVDLGTHGPSLHRIHGCHLCNIQYKGRVRTHNGIIEKNITKYFKWSNDQIRNNLDFK